jgi:glyoxylase-like metal-dependent hydrolase (beta-lactamase superfamily II)
MNEFRITALRLGVLEVDKSFMTYLSGPGEKLTLPVWAAAVEGAGLKILVDTGIKDHHRWDQELNPCWAAEDETLAGALAEIGWRAEEVDLVINSHLHYDHAENNTQLRNATFFISRVEWEYARCPIPSQKKLYDFEWTDEVVTYMNYTMVATDDFDVVPGLRLIQTPGHSRGHQSVVVNTSAGLVCIAGDAACLPESFSGPRPPGGATSIEQGFASLERIRSTAGRVIMGHDPNIAKYQSSGFPLILGIGQPLPTGSVCTLPSRNGH